MVGPALVAGGFALTALLYPRLPDLMPVHFDARGVADDFVAKPLGPFVAPVMGLVTYTVTTLAVRRMTGRARDALPIAIAAFGLFLVVVSLRAALGDLADLTRTTVIGTGLLVIVIGNYCGKLQPDRWGGMRSPWTIGDGEVWRRAHRIGGWMLVIAGIVAVVAAILGAPFEISIAPIVGAAVAAVAYSYTVYRRLRAASRD